MKSVSENIWHTIEIEGGYVNDSADRGGPTKYGITQETLSRWRGRRVSASEVKALTRNEAYQIYEARYYIRPHIDMLPGAVQPVVYDWGVNSGPTRAVQYLQRLCNRVASEAPEVFPDYIDLVVDGVIGKVTAGAVESQYGVMGPYFINAYCDVRQKFYDDIIARDPSQRRFKNGWRNRCDSFRVPV